MMTKMKSVPFADETRASPNDTERLDTQIYTQRIHRLYSELTVVSK